jgi:hypothetical protein
MAVKELGHGFTGAIDGGVRVLAMQMDRGGIAKVLHPIGAHGLHHLWQQRSGGVCIHIDSAHGDKLPLDRLYGESGFFALEPALNERFAGLCGREATPMRRGNSPDNSGLSQKLDKEVAC